LISTFYSPASQVVYTLTLENKGDATATDAVLTTSLASAITQKTWTAAFTGGATGAAVGAGDLNTKVTLPANGKAVFTIIANVGSSATGDLVSSATVAAASGETNTANNSATDTNRFVPNSIAVADDAGWSSSVAGAAGESRHGEHDRPGVCLRTRFQDGRADGAW
jgi:uncharacterized repeat protein (TIGR01451 family)